MYAHVVYLIDGAKCLQHNSALASTVFVPENGRNGWGRDVFVFGEGSTTLHLNVAIEPI